MQSKVQIMHFERIGHKESEIPFVRHYPKNFVSFGQMLIISIFIELTPILELNLFGISEHLNLMRMT